MKIRTLTSSQWADDQEAVTYNQMTARWASIKALFQKDPWGAEGLNGAKGKMAFMAAYNIDRFREFCIPKQLFKALSGQENTGQKTPGQ
jgi:hypothetical protein